jgi:hypothetical protein
VVGQKLIVFVCEGPTCKDRWDTPNPRGAIAGELIRRDCADSVRLEREICFGRCQHGPNVSALPVGAGGDVLASAMANVVDRLTVAAAGEAIARRVADLARAPAEDLAVAANPELA